LSVPLFMGQLNTEKNYQVNYHGYNSVVKKILARS